MTLLPQDSALSAHTTPEHIFTPCVTSPPISPRDPVSPCVLGCFVKAARPDAGLLCVPCHSMGDWTSVEKNAVDLCRVEFHRAEASISSVDAHHSHHVSFDDHVQWRCKQPQLTLQIPS